MATINLSDPSNGTTADAALIANNNALLEALLNGGIDNANINASAAITYAKLVLTAAIVNADISSSAAIAVSKLAPGTNTHVLTTTGGVAGWAAPAAPANPGTTKAGTYSFANNPLANTTGYQEGVSFGYTFSSPPTVLISLSTTTTSMDVYLQAHTVSTTGFIVDIWNNINNNTVVIAWIAYLP